MLNVSPARPLKTYPLIATRDSIFTVNLFFVNAMMKAWAQENYPDNWLAMFCATLCSAAIGTALSHPLDTVATRLQATHEEKNYLAMTGKIWKEGGLKTFYKGAQYRLFLFWGFSQTIPKAQEYSAALFDAICDFFFKDREPSVQNDARINRGSSGPNPALK